ncbi:MAG: hypothetical protein R3304_06355 [Longimicrobiales bacterium]|nr:hypothetical protein [Longimicrobiales bacterium]
MSADRDAVHEAIDRWERAELIDAVTAETLRAETGSSSTAADRRISQYMLAGTGAVVLVLAGGVFLDWAWPLLGETGRTLTLALLAIAVLSGGVYLETSERWAPAAYLMQTGGLALLLGAYVYSERAWSDTSVPGIVGGFLALATPVILGLGALRRNGFMPAVHFAMGMGFLAVFLDRATPLSADGVVWALDVILLLSVLTVVRILREDPGGSRYPWALNVFVTGMLAGFVLITWTSLEVLALDEWTLLPLDFWLLVCALLTLWGVHRAPAGLRRGWFGRMLTLEMSAWIVLGSATVAETFDAPPELAVLLVGGVGVVGFLHGIRHGLRGLMGAASLAFLVPVWWWSVERAGALGAVLALLVTAAFLFWASGRAGGRSKAAF